MTTYGTVFVVSGPTGVGKTTMIRALTAEMPHLSTVASVTTRAPRPGEGPGDYIFVDREEFTRMVDSGEFAEYAEVYGEMYGTPVGPIREVLSAGGAAVIDIDCRGLVNISQALGRYGMRSGRDIISVFLAPPTLESLYSRLRSRGMPHDRAQRRMVSAAEQLEAAGIYHRVIMAETQEQTLADMMAVVRSHRLDHNRLVWFEHCYDIALEIRREGGV